MQIEVKPDGGLTPARPQGELEIFSTLHGADDVTGGVEGSQVVREHGAHTILGNTTRGAFVRARLRELPRARGGRSIG